MNTKSSRIYFLILFLVTSHSVLAKVTIEESTLQKTYTFEVEGFTTEPITLEGKLFHKYVMRGVDGFDGLLSDEGEPEIPVIRIQVDAEGDISINSVTDVASVQPIMWPIIPGQPPSPKRPNARPRFAYNPISYESWGRGFEGLSKVEELSTVNGIKRRLVTLFPLQFNKVTQTVSLTKFIVQVPKQPEKKYTQFTSPETYAFVVAESLQKSPAVEAFARHKELLGYKISTIVVSDSMKDPKAIRSKLRDLYQESNRQLKYVLIIGSNSLVPGYSSPLLKESKGITDHYYRCLDNENYEADIAAPDVSIGRFSAQDESQLKIMVDKSIRYELGKFSTKEWLNQATFISTDDKNHWHIAEGSHKYTMDGYTVKHGYTGNFPEKGMRGGDRLFAISHKAMGTDVVTAMKEGRGFINYSGHGLIEEWEMPHVSKKDVQSITHPEALPFVISNSCDTAQIVKDSFAETWQRHAAGSILFLGSMDTSYWSEDAIFQRETAHALFRDQELATHQFIERSLNEVYRYFGTEEVTKYYWEIYMTLGEPTLRLRTKSPGKITSRVRFIRRNNENSGKYFILLDVKNNLGTPDSEVRIALSDQNSKSIGWVQPNESGRAFIPVDTSLFGTKINLSLLGSNLETEWVTTQIPAWHQQGHEEEGLSEEN